MLASISILILSASAPNLNLAELPPPQALAQLLWERSPDLQQARAKVAAVRADAVRAQLLPNPGLDISMNTIPVGPTNPADLQSPMANVPNYAVALSTLIELGKRGPRQEATTQAALAAALDALDQLRQRYHDLQDHLGVIASAEVRIDTLRQLAEDASHLSAIQKARMEKGDAAALDADRALLEEDTFRSNLSEAEESLITELRACSVLAGATCEPFGDSGRAAAFLERVVVVSPGTIEQRPDVKSLEATAASARAQLTLADRTVIPDPTLRVGYVRDQFVVSGNQNNSLFVGLTLPLPVFNRGQADAQSAVVAAHSAEVARDQLVAQAQRELQRIEEQARSLEARRVLLKDHAVPLARDVVKRLDSAVQRGGAGFQDLLLARRSLGELLINANELDLTSWRLGVARERATGQGVPLPEDFVSEQR